MKNYTYNFEIKDLLTQFVAAFDDTVVKRYDRSGNAKQEVEVRYVFAPKQRVMYDIVNKAQNLTLPVVAVDISSISYDDNRVFNKTNNLHSYLNEIDNTYSRMPVPINIDINMSIICRYMQDMEQIVTNFAPYSNPYIIIAWKEPSTRTETVEIRTEVLWSKNITMNTPTDLTYTDKFRVVADTSFTIKGWLFKEKTSTSVPIYFIDQNFIFTRENVNLTEALTAQNYEEFYNSLSAIADIQTRTLSGTPTITNIFYNGSGGYIPANDNAAITLNKEVSSLNLYNYITIGSNYDRTTAVLLSSNNTSLINLPLTTINAEYTGEVTGFVLPIENYQILSKDTLSLTFPYLSGSGEVDIIINNPAGWVSSRTTSGVYFIAE